MGTFSVWHWLIVLFLLLGLCIPIVAIAMANPTKVLTRLPYFWRVVGIMIVGLFIHLVAEAVVFQESLLLMGVVILGGLVAGVIISALSALWAVHRIQDVGAPKWWCLLLIVPIVNLIFMIVLMLYPGGHTPDQSTLVAQQK